MPAAMTDWFRRSTWTDADRADFYARLARSRGDFRKAQYLRIQAVHLEKAGGAELVRAALELLDEVIEKYPERMQLALAHLQRGTCLRSLGDFDAALAALQQALEAQRRYPNRQTDAKLEYGELVLSLERADLYASVLSALDEPGGLGHFPLDRYRSCAIRALILEQLGQVDVARTFAQHALDAAAQTKSGLRYHPSLGLVKDTGTDVHGRLLLLLGRTH